MTARLRKWAGILQNLTVLGMIALPATILLVALTTPITPETVARMIPNQTVSPQAAPAHLWAALALNLISPCILWVTLNEMRGLFGLFRSGDALSDQAARLIQRIGTGFFGLALVPFLLWPVQSVLLSWANPAGARALSVGLSSEMLFFALSGGLIIVIGWAMREAAHVRAENQSFI